MKDWFFSKKRPAHDPCHGKPSQQTALNAAALAVTIPLVTAFEGPQPPKIGAQFSAASEPLPQHASLDVGANRYGFRHFFFEVGYTPKP